LAAAFEPDSTFYLDRRFLEPGDDAVPFDLPAKPVVQQAFRDYQQLVLFMPVGAAVRLLAPCLGHKHRDPAVVCIDDAGRFAVSLLSGHVGGGDRLARQAAALLGATPVVTSASEVTGVLAVDLLGREFGWKVDADSLTVTRASAAVVNGEPVGVYQETGEPGWLQDRPLPNNMQIFPSLKSLMESTCTAALVITDLLSPAGQDDQPSTLTEKHVVLYRPKSLVVGLGCRRDVPEEELEQLLDETLSRHNLCKDSVKCIATAELKRDEVGIGLLSDKLGAPVHCYSADELNSVFQDRDTPDIQATETLAAGRPRLLPTPSETAHRLLGIWGVSEPAALLASGAEELLVTRKKTTRATVAVARIPFSEMSR
jgi:cobalt-precorrin 5A hydrolase